MPTSTPTSTSRFTAGRIAALVAIAAVALALGLVRFAGGEDEVRVPDRARAGQLTMKPCTYATEDGDVKADCGTLVVPENRQSPDARLIAVPVTRIRARSPNPGEPIFRLEGGPGKSNMDFPFAHRYTANHDLVMVGYRGVDGSVQLDCPEVDDARRTSGDLTGKRSVDASTKAFGKCADRLQDEGVDLGGYSLAERVDDLEAARRALRYGRVNLLSESFGTRIAMVYAARHAKSIRRSIMVGVNPPGGFLYSQQASDKQLDRFSAMKGEDVAAPIRRTVEDMPKRWGPFPIRSGNARVATFIGLMESSDAAGPLAAPATLDAWDAVTKGDASGLWFQSVAASLLLPKMHVWGDSASVARSDGDAVRRHFAKDRGNGPADAMNRFLWADGGMLREWPRNADDVPYARIRTSNVETLLVSGELDGATPNGPATAEVLRHLPNGKQVVLEGIGHTVDFWSQQPKAGARLINGFFADGRVDDSRYVEQPVDMTPGTTQTGVAKIIAGSLILLALITIGSLLWLATRARSGRRFGVKRGAAVRSVQAAVVGLGGWALVAVVAMIVVPDVPVDSEWLAVLAIAVPAGLAVHWASPAGRMVVTVAAAVAGAWIGFEAAASPLGILTAVPGAVAAANLAVIVRAMAARPETDTQREVEPEEEPEPETTPEPALV